MALRAEHALVTSGPYGSVRHPLYCSVALIAAFALLGPGLLAVSAVFALFTAYAVAVRVPAEEALLAARFGSAWRAYAARTGALIPRWLWPGGGGAENAPLVTAARGGDAGKPA